MTTYVTDSGHKILIDVIDRCYRWKDVEDQFGIDSLKVYMNKRGYEKIDTTDLDQAAIDYTLGDRDDFDPDEIDSRDRFLKEHWIEYFIYDGSYGFYKSVFDEKHADGFIYMEKKDHTFEEFLEAKMYFRRFLEGEFYYFQIHEPLMYIREDGANVRNKIRYRDYVDGGIFALDLEEIEQHVKDMGYGNIDRSTEDSNRMSYYEML